MKKVVFYGRTQVGSVVLSYLVAQGFDVAVIPEDEIIEDLAKMYGLKTVTLKKPGKFDLFICCHGSKFVPNTDKRYINMHSCLWKYKGKDPISRYIANKDDEASIESHYMTDEIDGGEVIHRELFSTPVVSTYAEYFNIALPYYYKCIDRTLKAIGWSKSVAMTRYRDCRERLGLWLDYYSKYFDKLIVFGFQVKSDDIDFLKRDYDFEFVDNQELDIYSEAAHQIVFKKQGELFKKYEWVFYSDVDEIVVPHPKCYKDLREYMKLTREKQTFCEGWNVVMGGDESPINLNKPILEQRKRWVRDLSGSYNKPCLSRIPTDWALGFHYIRGMEGDPIKSVENTGLYLFHLKSINDKKPPEYKDRDYNFTEPVLREIPKMFKGAF